MTKILIEEDALKSLVIHKGACFNNIEGFPTYHCPVFAKNPANLEECPCTNLCNHIYRSVKYNYSTGTNLRYEYALKIFLKKYYLSYYCKHLPNYLLNY